MPFSIVVKSGEDCLNCLPRRKISPGQHSAFPEYLSEKFTPMSPRKNTYKKQAPAPASVEDRWIPANSASAKSFLPKLELRNLNASAEQKAVLSHWAQTLGTPFAKPFERTALEILEVKETAESFADAPPQILFPDLFDIPSPQPEDPNLPLSTFSPESAVSASRCTTVHLNIGNAFISSPSEKI